MSQESSAARKFEEQQQARPEIIPGSTPADIASERKEYKVGRPMAKREAPQHEPKVVIGKQALERQQRMQDEREAAELRERIEKTESPEQELTRKLGELQREEDKVRRKIAKNLELIHAAQEVYPWTMRLSALFDANLKKQIAEKDRTIDELKEENVLLTSDLDDLAGQQHRLGEDLQMERHRKMLAGAEGVARKIPATPKNVLEKEAQDREQRLADFPDEELEKQLKELEEQKTKQKLEEPVKKLKTKLQESGPTFSEGIAQKAEAEKVKAEVWKDMTVQELESPENKYVPNAHALWKTVADQLKTMPAQDRRKAEELMNGLQKPEDMPATKFVYEIARLHKAEKLGADPMIIAQIRGRIESTADALGLHDDPEVHKALDPEFRRAMETVPNADKFVELVHNATALENYEGVSPVARDYLKALSDYLHVRNGTTEQQQAAWSKFSRMNEELGISGNALVQSVIARKPGVRDVNKGKRQREDIVRNINRRTRI